MGKVLKPAINDIRTIVYTDKTSYVMGMGVEDAKILVYHGSTGNGKTITSTVKFLGRIYNAPRDQQTFLLAGRDIKALERRFIESNRSVFNWWPFRGKWEYKAQGKGGARVIVKTRTGDKFIYLTPFNNVSAYSRILGDTIDGVLIDEAVEADEMFLEEIVARINRTEGSWGIFTSNGGDPNHFFYTGIVNRSIRIEELVEGVIPTPIEEVRYYDKVDRMPEYVTVHMALEDNPVYTEEQLERFYNMYPVGSFMYNSRILGVRGFTQNAPFSPYMTGDVFIGYDELTSEGFYPDYITFAVDVGGHVFHDDDLKVKEDMYGKWYGGYKKGDHGTESGGHTGMLTVGWSRDYKRMVVLDTYFPNHMYDYKNIERIYERVYNITTKFPRVRKPYMFCDTASPSFYSLLRDSKSNVGQVRPAIKRDNKINLDEKEAIALIQQYMMDGRFKILDTPGNRTYFYDAMVQANLESDGKLVDNKKEEADIQDMLKYQFTSMYRFLIR